MVATVLILTVVMIFLSVIVMMASAVNQDGAVLFGGFIGFVVFLFLLCFQLVQIQDKDKVQGLANFKKDCTSIGGTPQNLNGWLCVKIVDGKVTELPVHLSNYKGY